MPKPTGSSDEAEADSASRADAHRDLVERMADHALEAVRAMPPLALMAAIAALFELALARLAWHGLTELLDGNELRDLRRWARFPQNLAAVAGTFSLTLALLAYLRLPGYAPIGRRLAVAAFSGIFVPSVVVATFLPYATLRPKLVVFGLAAANVLVTLLGMTAVRYRAARSVRLAMAGVSLACFLTLLVVGVGQLATLPPEGLWAPVSILFATRASETQALLLTMRHAGELAWVGAVLGAAWAAVSLGGENARVRVVGALVLFALLAAATLLVQETIGHRFRLALFGSFRLGLLIDTLPGAYALPLSAGLAGGLVGLGRSDPALRQLGAGLLLWIAAGFAPHTPIQLLYLVLGVALMARAAQALDPTGAWRARQPWARLVPAPPEQEHPLGPRADDGREHETYDDL